MQIPFVDLKAQYQTYRQEIDAVIKQVIDETAFIGGDFVKGFEAAYAKTYGVKHCISVANGTDAIYIVLKMLGIGQGDEVITVANSWISTSEAITQAGATPVFIDVDDFFHIDASRIEAKINSQTKAILPVHLYGQPAQMDELTALCEKHSLLLIEDCAQSHFAEFRGRRTGTFGVAGTFSFYPGKNLGAYGDAGAIITNDDSLATRVRMYANHGALKKHEHLMEGVNSRLDALQAAILSVKLPHIGEWNGRRRELAALYDSLLNGVEGIKPPRIRPNSSHVFHLYVIRSNRRDHLQAYLSKHGVQTAIHYPTALPLLEAYKHLRHRPEDFPCAYRNQSEILSLPIYPEMTDAMVAYVVQRIKEFSLTA